MRNRLGRIIITPVAAFIALLFFQLSAGAFDLTFSTFSRLDELNEEEKAEIKKLTENYINLLKKGSYADLYAISHPEFKKNLSKEAFSGLHVISNLV